MSMDPGKVSSSVFASTQAVKNAASSEGSGGKETQASSPQPAETFQHHGRVYDFGAKLAARLRSLGHGDDRQGSGLLPPDSPVQELSTAELRRMLSPEAFKGLVATSSFPKAGQERLLSALKTASEIKNPGYNVFITRFGGDEQVVANLLREFPPAKQNPKDYVYVRNFDDVNQPSLIIFQPGEAHAFGDTMDKTIKGLVDNLPTVKGSSDFIKGRVDIEEKAQGEAREKVAALEKDLNKSGFGMEKIEREDGPPAAMIGLKLILPADQEEGEDGKAKKGGKQISIVPMELLEKAASQVEAVGLNPVFVLRQTTAGPAYEIMGDKEYQEKVAAQAVKLGQNPPPAFDLNAVKSQFSEFHRKSLELNAAQEAVQTKANKELQNLLQAESGKLVDKALQPVRDAYPGEYVGKYLDGVKDTMLKSLFLFVNRDEALAAASKDSDDSDLLFVKKRLTDSLKPNVLTCSDCAQSGSKFPIVYEKDPTWENLLGTIREPNMIMGKDLPLDRHKNIKAGSLLKAQGGYLVVDLLSAARSGSLGGLLRAVTTGKLQIESPYYSSNHPEPVPLNVKVVILDPEGYYDYLAYSDKQFGNNFVKAPYDMSPKADKEILRDFSGNLLEKAKTENLLPVEPSALSSIMEEAMASRESQERFTADFPGAMDLLREANSVAQNQGAREISADHVKAALAARKLRLGGTEERMRESQGPSAENKPFVIETRGAKVGQINGLSVYMMHANRDTASSKGLYDAAKGAFGEDWVKANAGELAKAGDAIDAARAREANLSLDEYRATRDKQLGYDGTFGGPSRITATARNSEGFRVTSNDLLPDWVGPSGKKAYTNLESYFGEKFGYNNKRLFGEGRLSFEQSYSGHDGDSATMAETIAVLSAFSGVPIKQGIAITGSMDEHGMAQAIGGVNFKIAGYFDECKKQGLDGQQGVVIPASNVKDLMLRPDIVQAVKDGQFHIWPVKTVDQAIEKLTGVKAGTIDPATGRYEKGTVFGQVEQRLDDFRKNQKLTASGDHLWNIAK